MQGVDLDLIRFNTSSFTGGAGSLVFYSDSNDGVDSLADGVFPGATYANSIDRFEVGPEGNNGFTYTPTAGQPGFVAGAAGPVTYDIISDNPAPVVPEPSSLALLASGGLPLLGFLRRRRLA